MVNRIVLQRRFHCISLISVDLRSYYHFIILLNTDFFRIEDLCDLCRFFPPQKIEFAVAF